MKRCTAGFTLIEVIIVIVIMAILATVALRSASIIGEGARTEEAMQELDALAFAITGNPALGNNGVRSDYGYVGNIGALPPNLDALRANPGFATWNGPYIVGDLTQDSLDFKTDPWGAQYTIEGINMSSTGSSEPIVRSLAGSESALLRNSVAGVVVDANGASPGADYCDSVEISLTFPNGAGGVSSLMRTPDAGGYFAFDSIPIGNHDLRIVYLPDNDTLHRFVALPPGVTHYADYYLGSAVWSSVSATGTGIGFVENSDTLNSPNCEDLSFRIANLSGTPIVITSMIISWASPTAYYDEILWSGDEVYDLSALGSGETATFDSPKTLSVGASAEITISDFRSSPGSGGKIDMTGTDFTIQFSDGSVITFTADYCD